MPPLGISNRIIYCHGSHPTEETWHRYLRAATLQFFHISLPNCPLHVGKPSQKRSSTNFSVHQSHNSRGTMVVIFFFSLAMIFSHSVLKAWRFYHKVIKTDHWNIDKWPGVTILLWTIGQGHPTPINTPTPHTQTYKKVSKTFFYLFTRSLRTHGQMDGRTNGRTGQRLS